MEKLNYEFALAANNKAQAIQQQILVGVVGSGDLEVMVERNQHKPSAISIQITTSVDGMSHVWEALMQRIFADTELPALQIEINDFGATPGVVRLRLEQALEELGLAN